MSKRKMFSALVTVMATVLLVSFQNCAPQNQAQEELSTLELSQPQGNAAVAKRGQISSTGRSTAAAPVVNVVAPQPQGGQGSGPALVTSPNQRRPATVITPAQAGGSSGSTQPQGPQYKRLNPTFSLGSVVYDAATKSIMFSVNIGNGRYYGLDVVSTDNYPVYVQAVTLSNLASMGMWAIPAQAVQSSEKAIVYKIGVTDLMIKTKSLNFAVKGLCDVIDENGNAVANPINFDPSCSSNTVALTLAAAAITLNAPGAVYNGEALPTPFIADNIFGTMAGCNLEDRSGNPGSSVDGTIERCNWLSSPPGWVKSTTVANRWTFNQPLSTGNGASGFARFVVVDIVDGKIRAVSAIASVSLVKR